MPVYSDNYYRQVADEEYPEEGFEIDAEAVVLRHPEMDPPGAYVTFLAWVPEPRAEDGKQFETRCPDCGDPRKLRVIQVTLVRTGETHTVNELLEPDGFYVNLDDEKDQSTTDEIVRCSACTKTYPLTELMLEETHDDSDAADISGPAC